MTQVVTLILWLALAGFAGYQYGVGSVAAVPTSEGQVMEPELTPEASELAEPKFKKIVGLESTKEADCNSFDMANEYFSGDNKVALALLGFDYKKVENKINAGAFRKTFVREGDVLSQVATNNKIVENYKAKRLYPAREYEVEGKSLVKILKGGFWATKETLQENSGHYTADEIQEYFRMIKLLDENTSKGKSYPCPDGYNPYYNKKGFQSGCVNGEQYARMMEMR